MINFIKNHRLLSIIILFNIIAIIIVILIGINQASKTATLDIMVAPNNATITLNGKKYENNQSHNIKPGTYEVIISMNDMTTKTETIEITKDAFVRLHTYLLDSNNTFNYYKTHRDDFYILEKIADQSDTKAQEFITWANHAYSITEQLPIEYYERTDTPFAIYIDRSENNCDKIVCLSAYVNGNPNRINQTIETLIENSGFDIKDYDIKIESNN